LIQDKCVKLSIIKYREERSHKEEEERLASIKVDKELVNEYTEKIKDEVEYYHPKTPREYVRRLISYARPKDKTPEGRLHRATALTRLVAEKVLDKSPPPDDLLKRYKRRVLLRKLLIGISVSVSILYIIILGILYDKFVNHVISGFRWIINGIRVVTVYETVNKTVIVNLFQLLTGQLPKE